MSLSVTTLFSGSSGNCALISADGRRFLIDAGVSAKRIRDALAALSVDVGSIEAVFVTHDHIDHVRGLAVLSRTFRVPVMMNVPTARACIANRYFAPEDFTDNLFLFENAVEYSESGLCVRSFDVPHDAAAPVGYRFEYKGECLAAATDTGHVTDSMIGNFYGCGTAVIEANHDPEMLNNGPYPQWLKDRIASPVGHLSNGDCADFAEILSKNGAKEIILAHISRENNTPELALRAVEKKVRGTAVETAKRDLIKEG